MQSQLGCDDIDEWHSLRVSYPTIPTNEQSLQHFETSCPRVSNLCIMNAINYDFYIQNFAFRHYDLSTMLLVLELINRLETHVDG